MEHVLQDLIAALRGSGVRISVSESIDAMNALRLMGYDNRQILKTSLSATLAKSRHDKALFDSCFDRFYSLDDFIDPETNFCSTPDSGRQYGPVPFHERSCPGSRHQLNLVFHPEEPVHSTDSPGHGARGS